MEDTELQVDDGYISNTRNRSRSQRLRINDSSRINKLRGTAFQKAKESGSRGLSLGDYLDWSDPKILLQRSKHLSGNQAYYLDALMSKVDKLPTYYDRDSQHYKETVALLLMGDYQHAEKIASCQPYNRCKTGILCPYCANLRSYRMHLRYAPAYYKGDWRFVTISPVKGDHIDEFTLNETEDALLTLRYVCKKLYDMKLFSGAIYRQELAIATYYPNPIVLPHLHLIIEGGKFPYQEFAEMVYSNEAVKKLYRSQFRQVKNIETEKRERVRKHTESDIYNIEVPLSVQSSPIPNQDRFLARIRYLVKPLDIYTPYSQGMESSAIQSDWREHRELNVQVRNFMNYLAMIRTEANKVDTWGSCRPGKSPKYIGVPTDELNDNEAMLQSLYKEAVDKHNEITWGGSEERKDPLDLHVQIHPSGELEHKPLLQADEA